MSDIGGTIKELSTIMQTAATAGVVDRMIEVYDSFATLALQVLLDRAASDANAKIWNATLRDPSVLAETAWKIADAMVLERRKRSLGGPLLPDCAKGDQEAGYRAKGYGCKNPSRCVYPQPHHLEHCIIEGDSK